MTFTSSASFLSRYWAVDYSSPSARTLKVPEYRHKIRTKFESKSSSSFRRWWRVNVKLIQSSPCNWHCVHHQQPVTFSPFFISLHLTFLRSCINRELALNVAVHSLIALIINQLPILTPVRQASLLKSNEWIKWKIVPSLNISFLTHSGVNLLVYKLLTV